MPGLKTGVENAIFWSQIRSGFGEPGGTPPPPIPPRSSRKVFDVGSPVLGSTNGQPEKPHVSYLEKP